MTSKYIDEFDSIMTKLIKDIRMNTPIWSTIPIYPYDFEIKITKGCYLLRPITINKDGNVFRVKRSASKHIVSKQTFSRLCTYIYLHIKHDSNECVSDIECTLTHWRLYKYRMKFIKNLFYNPKDICLYLHLVTKGFKNTDHNTCHDKDNLIFGMTDKEFYKMCIREGYICTNDYSTNDVSVTDITNKCKRLIKEAKLERS